MKSIFKIMGVATVALALAQSLQAIPIVGSLNFVGQCQLNSSSVNTATAETAWASPVLTAASSGAFSTTIPSSPPAAGGMIVTMSSAVWNFNDPSTPIASFWSVGGFTFNLQSSSIASQGGGFLNVNALGMVTAAGYDPTLMLFKFSIQDGPSGTPPVFSWSAATQNVPDGASTVMLLGIALSGVALLKRKLSA